MIREEAGVSDAPKGFEEAFTHKESYWSCLGERLVVVPHFNIVAFYTKEEAEAHSSIPCETWRWNRKPARRQALADLMFGARADGFRGVKITGYRNGEWVTLHEYPVGVPLESEMDK